MKIGIAGYGFVGKAHENVLSTVVETVVSDPAQGHFGSLLDCDGVIVCVSTPSREDGSCEMTNVYEVIESLPDHIPVLIKSTISLEGWQMLKATFPTHDLTFSPEFLRADHAYVDFITQKKIFFGGGNISFWAHIMKAALPHATPVMKDPKSLIVAKVARNAYFAVKVSFFNQIHDYCHNQELDFEDIRQLITADERIGVHHSKVTKERGFGGHCLPKDSRALVVSAHKADVSLPLISSALEYNKRFNRE